MMLKKIVNMLIFLGSLPVFAANQGVEGAIINTGFPVAINPLPTNYVGEDKISAAGVVAPINGDIVAKDDSIAKPIRPKSWYTKAFDLCKKHPVEVAVGTVVSLATAYYMGSFLFGSGAVVAAAVESTNSQVPAASVEGQALAAPVQTQAVTSVQAEPVTPVSTLTLKERIFGKKAQDPEPFNKWYSDPKGFANPLTRKFSGKKDSVVVSATSAASSGSSRASGVASTLIQRETDSDQDDRVYPYLLD